MPLVALGRERQRTIATGIEDELSRILYVKQRVCEVLDRF